ncbi:membrane fusion protein (multidrug efflux system) [Silvimonas terrae]|uniref:Membrane fusion protein (Multidrug efflux system) n=1 Tax=Silvimonas terrae TaxID=300266 RepID=A0A840RJA2_9NEIS|nr:efflux RND transporter periplasmic adaptor subunit [Silvimonas terrae]MBB5192386.1 membrane fusion protein (multidrug efflux system) [Silvimonas terrae]
MTTETNAAQPAEQQKRRKPVMAILTTVFVLAGIGYGIYYATVLSQREETDNAYVGGNLVTLTSQVSGTVTEIRADETQFVKAGEELVKLDPVDAKVALAQSEAALGDSVRQLRQQYANAAQYDAALAQRKIDLARAQDDLNRRAPLAADHTVSSEEVSHAKDSVENAKAALDVAEKQAAAAHAAIDGVDIPNNPTVLRARANFEQAWLSVQRNAIVAPASGYVAKRGVQVGARITPGQSLLSIVPLDQVWVDANFKESELRNIRIGQPAKLTADIYGGKVEYSGKVVGLGAGTGSAFSLLPAQNATGNWIKVVQRVPVRIELDKKDLAEHPLRVGLSMVVDVDTHNRDGAVLSAAPENKPLFSTEAFTQPMQDADKLADSIVRKNLGK